MPKLLYQGHGSFRIVSDKGLVIYVDPYVGEGYDLPADIVLITHDHFDHSQLKLIKQKEGCVIIKGEQAFLDGKHITVFVLGVTIQAVEAGNKNHDPANCVGFIIEVDGIKIYASGDTSKTKQMETFAAKKLDYALLCCDGIYNMDLDEAAECATLIAARHTIPVHMKPKQLFDPERAAAFKAKNKLIMKDNTEIEL